MCAVMLYSTIFKPVSAIERVGPDKAKLMKKLGISTVRDLLLYMPYRVMRRSLYPKVRCIMDGQDVALECTVEKVEVADRRSRRPHVVLCSTEDGFFELVYFNLSAKAIHGMFGIGRRMIVLGKAAVQYGYIKIAHPEQILELGYKEKVRMFEPVYNVTAGLSSRVLGSVIRGELASIRQLEEWLPRSILDFNKWPSWKEALGVIHNPRNECDLEKAHTARSRLAFDEILHHQILLRTLRKRVRSNARPPMRFSGRLVTRLEAALPFELTSEQKRAISEISTDMSSDFQMMRLLQGDVGSGKTIVALSAMLNAVESGGQAVLMVPTEILAMQHFANIVEYLKKLEDKVSAVLLMGKMSASSRRDSLGMIQSGAASIIVGTHALMQQSVQYNDLKLVVIDEQHRFGVMQRQELIKKSQYRDLLMMTATPIPRTLEMAMYGDMDVSRITQKPKNRKEIITSVISSAKIEELEHSISSKIELGQKAYWVCPLIEATEKSDFSHVQHRFEELQKKFPGKVAMLHGKMKQQEKQSVMEKYIRGEKMILVATTVIEVGVDVKDATVMIIENAERFGLAQLHQLRGRVGRGEMQSYCILIHGHACSPIARQRLTVMKESSDGFVIAQKDLMLRGAGDVVGLQQSGDLDFKVFDIIEHETLVGEAHRLAQLESASWEGLMRVYSKILPT